MSLHTARIFTNLLLAGACTLTLAACGSSDTRNADQAPAAAAAENTRRNAADTTDTALTPMDQGENALDLAITKTVRQIIVEDNTLSTNAHNIKIITYNGRVTLRGPVDSQAERDRLTTVAQGVAGVNSVDSQLEVAQH